jgi:hypothetical protein
MNISDGWNWFSYNRVSGSASCAAASPSYCFSWFIDWEKEVKGGNKQMILTNIMMMNIASFYSGLNLSHCYQFQAAKAKNRVFSSSLPTA